MRLGEQPPEIMAIKRGIIMQDTSKKTAYNINDAQTKLKRIPLDVQKEKYEEIAAAAANAGESVNGYIKVAIDQRIERDGAGE